MKRLSVLRHAKSDWDNPELDDFDRPLSSRGLEAAKIIAREVEYRKLQHDLVIASPAVRSRQTLKAFEGSNAIGEICFESELYLASLASLLSIIRSISEKASSVLLIGHNPGLHELVLTLAKRPSSLEQKIASKFPTAALAQLEIPSVRWNEVREKSATIEAILLPRELD